MHTAFINKFATYFIGAFLVAILNYAFYPILGRMLDLVSFGELQTLISILTLFGIVLGALVTIVVHAVASKGSVAEVADDLQKLQSVVATLTIIGVLVGILLIPALKMYLQFTSTFPFFLLYVCVFTTLVASVSTALLQGVQDFFKTSILNISQSAVKLVVATACVFFGMGISGAMLGLIAASTSAYFFVKKSVGFIPLVIHFSPRAFFADVLSVKELLRFGVTVLLAQSAIAFLFTFDMIIVKALFSPDEAGLYAGITSIAKIAFFALTPMSTVLLPMVSAAKGDRSLLVITAGTILLLMTAVGLTIVYLFPVLLTQILFGNKYTSFSYILPVVATGMAFLGLIQNITAYGLALRATILGKVLPCSALMFAVLCFFIHETIMDIAINFTASTGTCLVVLCSYYLRERYRYS
ncbi:MAG: hypothetical protein RI911_874 [Candidatus Parcubacteria bacterium]|jgi:O-antigen/teichoic acid export membrane protein